jgi:hypothetical protein
MVGVDLDSRESRDYNILGNRLSQSLNLYIKIIASISTLNTPARRTRGFHTFAPLSSFTPWTFSKMIKKIIPHGSLPKLRMSSQEATTDLKVMRF